MHTYKDLSKEIAVCCEISLILRYKVLKPHFSFCMLLSYCILAVMGFVMVRLGLSIQEDDDNVFTRS